MHSTPNCNYWKICNLTIADEKAKPPADLMADPDNGEYENLPFHGMQSPPNKVCATDHFANHLLRLLLFI